MILESEMSKKDILIAELKHLEWYKMVNSSALKAALKQARSLKNAQSKQKDNQTLVLASSTETNFKQSSELQTKKEFNFQPHLQSMDPVVHPINQAEFHMNSLLKQRQKIEESQELKLRTQQYREWKKDISRRKDLVLNGNQLENYKNPNVETSIEERQIIPESLKQLAELEKRISALEINMVSKQNNDMVDKRLREFKMNHAPLKPDKTKNLNPISQRRSLKKLKQLDENSATRFQPRFGQHYLERSRASKENFRSRQNNNNNNGTFLTQSDRDYDDAIDLDVEVSRESQIKESRRKMAMATDGQKALRARIQARKLQSYKQNLTNPAKNIPVRIMNIKTKNKYMNEFEKIKNDYAKRREESMNKLKMFQNSQEKTNKNNYLNINILPNERNAENILRSQTTNSTITRKTMSVPALRRPVSDASISLGINGIRKLKIR